MDVLIEIVISVMFFVLQIIVFFFPVFIFILARKRAKKKVINESLSIIDLKKSKEYYRGILENYTPFIISYIDNFEINFTRDIIATLLNLELKKKIEIREGSILIKETEIHDLKRSEQYIMENIKDGKVKILNNILEQYIKEDCVESKLLVKNNVTNKDKKYKPTHLILLFLIPGVSIMFFVLSFNLLAFVLSFSNNTTLIVLAILTFIIVFVVVKTTINYLFINKSFYNKYKSDSYYRTKTGEELNTKIEGLKNYIRDFGNLSEKERNELVLWEDYLLYSVIFDLNTNIIDDMSALIE